MVTLAFALLLGQLQPLPSTLVPLDSDEGRKLLVESTANRDFFALSSQFLTQKTTSFCGVATTVMALNAMPIEAPVAAEWAPFRAFTEDNVFNAEASKFVPREKVLKGGLTISELAYLARSNHVGATEVYASDSTLEKFRDEAVKNLNRPDDYVLVDFLRAELGQDMGAHWSPIAAYHQPSDRFLVLDVARFRYPPYWAKADDLFRAMNTSDPDSGRSRGWVVIAKEENAPGRKPVAPVGNRMVRVVLGIGGGLFVVGAVVGAVVMWLRLRKRITRTV